MVGNPAKVAARTEDQVSRLEAALRAVWDVRPANWDDDEDPDQRAAFMQVREALAELDAFPPEQGARAR